MAPIKNSFFIARWSQHQQQIKLIRETVFIKEQNVPVELEWDGLDEQACHILAEQSIAGKKQAIATARILLYKEHAHIGRMAVLPQWRHQGVGSELLQICIKECLQQKIKKIVLNAQVYALPFYKKAGFEVSSDKFLDAGIPHQQMTMILEKGDLKNND